METQWKEDPWEGNTYGHKKNPHKPQETRRVLSYALLTNTSTRGNNPSVIFLQTIRRMLSKKDVDFV